MAIVFSCPCGRELRVPDDRAGRRGRCPACGDAVTIPSSSEPPREEPSAADAPPTRTAGTSADSLDRPRVTPSPRPITSSRPVASSRPAPAGPTWNRRYWLLGVALLPLVLTLLPGADDEALAQRIERTVESAPKAVQERVEQIVEKPGATLDDLVCALPRERVEGAFVGRRSKLHWVFALVSAGAFLGAILAIFPRGKDVDPKHLLYGGLFTGTIGIVFLLAVQLCAEWTQGVWIRGGGKGAIIFYLLKFIGYSYRAALDPENGFIPSLLGFTLGVGLCEELVKLIPLIFHYKNRASLDWRGACLWGLASGVGFGVSEGITYSSDFYNGLSGGSIYVVRFVSCVALHAIWAASCGIVLHRMQTLVQGAGSFVEMLAHLVRIAIVPMVLHGLYDTLLKRDLGWVAILTALASMGWLAFQIERMRKEEGGLVTA